MYCNKAENFCSMSHKRWLLQCSHCCSYYQKWCTAPIWC